MRLTYIFGSIAGIILLLLIASPFFLAGRQYTLAGVVTDCITKAPIAGAEVVVNNRTWGISNGRLVWDKDYIYKTMSDEAGKFSLQYKVGPVADVVTSKAGYLRANSYTGPTDTLQVGLRHPDPAHPHDLSSQACKLASECMQTTIENGYTVVRNICPKS